MNTNGKKKRKRLYTTELTALNKQGHFVNFQGFNIWAYSFADAQRLCDTNGLGYLRVTGEFIWETVDSIAIDFRRVPGTPICPTECKIDLQPTKY